VFNTLLGGRFPSLLAKLKHLQVLHKDIAVKQGLVDANTQYYMLRLELQSTPLKRMASGPEYKLRLSEACV